MKKLLLAAAITVAAASQASAASYTFDGATNDSSGTVTLTYNVEPALTGTWDIDLVSGAFSGNIYLGDYETHTNVSLGMFGSMSGDITYVGANQVLTAGTGSYDAGTRTFTYSVPTGGANSGVASAYSETSSSCSDSSSVSSGSGSVAGSTVCGTRAGTNGAWEGLTISMVFAEDLQTFTTNVTAIERSGSGLTANTTSIYYTGNGVADVPVPAAAWLFGSALIGLAGVGRKRKMV